MTAFVFLGPSLPVAEARAEFDAVYLPPVAQGDVYRVASRGAQAIGIVDGYFQRVPAVWHKEILWAISRGVHVFGSASMGALRAAELAPFGMEGVGTIFEAFRDGVLKDDDEVAVTHSTAESGYAALSEAMVNIRATLAAAESERALSPSTRAELERIAKDLYYPDRSYPLVLRRAVEQGQPAAELDAFRAWLPVGRVDQKRADAIAMLRQMRLHLAEGSPPKQAPFRLEPTLQWQRAIRSADLAPMGPADGVEAVRLDALLDELGLLGEAYPQAYRETLLGELALREAEQGGSEAVAADLERMRTRFCRERGLSEQDGLQRWLQENQLTRERFEVLLREEVLRSRVAERLEVTTVGRLPDHLRLVGVYGELRARAEQKRRSLEAQGLQHSGLAELGLTEEDLLQWHFARLHRPVPIDIDDYARAHGFGSAATFLRALLREYCYSRVQEPAASQPRLADLTRAALASLQRGGTPAPGDAAPGGGGG